MKHIWSSALIACLMSQVIAIHGADGAMAPADRINRITMWAQQKKTNAQRLFFCLKNPTQCTAKEVNTARTWLIGVPVATVVAIATVAGIVLTTKKIVDMKTENAQQASAARMNALKQEPFYAAIGRAYSNLAQFLSQHHLFRDAGPQFAYTKLPYFIDEMVENVPYADYDRFKNSLSDALDMIYQQGQQTFGVEFKDELEKECNDVGTIPREKDFICKVKNQFEALDKFNRVLKVHKSDIEQAYANAKK